MVELTAKRLAGALLAVALLVPCRTLLAKPNLSDFKSKEGKLTLKPGESIKYSVEQPKTGQLQAKWGSLSSGQLQVAN